MTRLILALMFVAYANINTGVVFAQDKLANQGGTVHGQITDIMEAQNPKMQFPCRNDPR